MSDARHWIVVAEHAWCSTAIDRVVAYRSDDLITWNGEVIMTHSYVPDISAGPWFKGIPFFTSATLDLAGNLHVLYEARQSASIWGTPGRIQYAMQSGPGWVIRPNVFDDTAIQTSQGNSGGAPYSAVGGKVAFDHFTSKLVFLGSDGAWFATKYNAVTSSAPPGGDFSSPVVVATRVGAVDRSAITNADQDFHGSLGLQVWDDRPSCAISGRVRDDLGWSAITTAPMPYPPCSSSPSNHWNFWPEPQVVITDDGPEILTHAHDTAGGNHMMFWTRDFPSDPTTTSFQVAPMTSGRAFLAPDGRLGYLRFVVPTSTLEVWFPASGDIVALLVTTRKVEQVDIARRDPRSITWTERDASGIYLRSAAIDWGQMAGCAVGTGTDGTRFAVCARMGKATTHDAYCRSVGFDGLASIRTPEEQALLASLAESVQGDMAAGRQVWIGYSDAAEEGQWRWSDGAPTTFASWAQTEPSGGTTENCAIMSSFATPAYAWQDVPCDRPLYYPACERR